MNKEYVLGFLRTSDRHAKVILYSVQYYAQHRTDKKKKGKKVQGMFTPQRIAFCWKHYSKAATDII